MLFFISFHCCSRSVGWSAGTCVWWQSANTFDPLSNGQTISFMLRWFPFCVNSHLGRSRCDVVRCARTNTTLASTEIHTRQKEKKNEINKMNKYIVDFCSFFELKLFCTNMRVTLPLSVKNTHPSPTKKNHLLLLVEQNIISPKSWNIMQFHVCMLMWFSTASQHLFAFFLLAFPKSYGFA